MASEDDNDDGIIYTVVINPEEQYSIWPAHKKIPDGWTSCGVEGKKSVCLEHIEKVWVDMRPLSLRKSMAARAETAAIGNS